MAIPELIVLIYFIYVVAYTFIFSAGAFFYRSPPVNPQPGISRFCVLIPAYKEDAVILDSAKKALEQTYPKDKFTVAVIADSLQPETLAELRLLPITVVEVHFESSTKVKSLNYALSSLPENFDFAVILDGDNVMHPSFLQRINSIVSPTVRAVQGQRMPKNKNNTLALLDGISEAINNHVYRQGSAGLGLSASISGSGVVFDYAIFRKKISGMSSVGGFDRELELLLLMDGIKVHYLKEAIVLDEKISQTKAFQNQRKRWISSQYFYLRKYFSRGMSALFRGDFTFFNSAVLRNIQLPRLINIGLITVLTGALFFIRHYLYFGYGIWICLFVINTIAIFIAIPREFYTMRLLSAIAGLPMIFVRMLLMLFKLKGANKKFIHTQHGVPDPKSGNN